MSTNDMRALFPGHYSPSQEEFAALWDGSLFVLDANVLLSAYRFSTTTRQTLFDMLIQLKDRLWIPHQAALEYQRNRLTVIQTQKDAFDALAETVRSSRTALTVAAEALKRHPVLESTVIASHVDQGFKPLETYIEQRRELAPELFDTARDLIADDSIRSELTDIIGVNVGQSFTPERLAQLYSEADERFAAEVPPGYLDAEKEAPQRYGDYILWVQVIEKAAAAEKDVILVTDDTKEDWWWRFKGRTLGPRAELVEELRAKAGRRLHMYGSVRFLEEAGKFLSREVSQATLQEVQEVVRWTREQSRLTPGASTVELREMLELGYTGPVVCRLVGISYRQLHYWTATGLVRASLAEAQGSGSVRRYSEDDILELMLVKRMLDMGLSLQRVRSVLERLSEASIPVHAHLAVVVHEDEVVAIQTESELHDYFESRPLGGLAIDIASLRKEFRVAFNMLAHETRDRGD